MLLLDLQASIPACIHHGSTPLLFEQADLNPCLVLGMACVCVYATCELKSLCIHLNVSLWYSTRGVAYGIAEYYCKNEALILSVFAVNNAASHPTRIEN